MALKRLETFEQGGYVAIARSPWDAIWSGVVSTSDLEVEKLERILEFSGRNLSSSNNRDYPAQKQPAERYVMCELALISQSC